MSQDDSDRTILRPSPGGKRRPGRESQPRSQRRPTPGARVDRPAQRALGAEPLARLGMEGSGNALLGAAMPLLLLRTQLSATLDHQDPAGLYAQLSQQIAEFQNKARAAGASSEDVVAASYCLCTLLDEAVLGTPWGNTSGWSTNSLLSRFHDQATGGENFFLLLEKFQADQSRHFDILELMYACLALGFQGKYQLSPDGAGRLHQLEDGLGAMLASLRQEPDQDLSPNWQGVTTGRNALTRFVPLWVVSGVGAVAIALLYTGFVFALNERSDEAFRQLHALGRSTPSVLSIPEREADTLRVERTVSNLRQRLAAQIAAGEVELRQSAGEARIVITRRDLFGSGSANVNPATQPLLRSVAAALATTAGPILVTGHTDDVPIRTVRFPSNWQLSQERATAVARVLAAELGSGQRFSVEGRADSEPLVPNDSAENRARNRRVEVNVAIQGGAT